MGYDGFIVFFIGQTTVESYILEGYSQGTVHPEELVRIKKLESNLGEDLKRLEIPFPSG